MPQDIILLNLEHNANQLVPTLIAPVAPTVSVLHALMDIIQHLLDKVVFHVLAPQSVTFAQ